MGSVRDLVQEEEREKGQQVKKMVYSLEQEMGSVSFNVLHRIIDEMKKKEKILEQVLDQTKHIRQRFDKKDDELEAMKDSVGDILGDVKALKCQVEDMTQLKANLQKMKQELTKMKIMQKVQVEKQKEVSNSRSLLEWHKHLEHQQKQQKLCKACRREAKQRYKAHRSQEW